MTVDPSAAPVRERGLHSRAGNAMQRTRAAVLDGAARAVEKHGARRATMADIAMLAGIAKGTLYNHFRTKEAVYAATVDAAVRSLADECAAVARDDLAEALAVAAERVSSHPALRRVASDEPLVLAQLVQLPGGGIGDVARSGVRDVLSAAATPADPAAVDPAAVDPAAVDLVLRWLVSFVATAGTGLEAQAALLAAALRAGGAGSPSGAGAGSSAGRAEPVQGT